VALLGDAPAHVVLRRLAHPLPAPCARHARAVLAPRVRLLCACRSPPLQRGALALRRRRRGTDAGARGRVSAGRSWLWDLRRSDALAQMHTVQVHERDWSPARVAEEGSAQALDEALEGLERVGGGALMLVGDFISRDIVADPESLREIRARIALPPRFRALCTLLRIPSLCPGGARLTRSGVRASRLRQEAARLFSGLELVFELPSLAAWVQVRRRGPAQITPWAPVRACECPFRPLKRGHPHRQSDADLLFVQETYELLESEGQNPGAVLAIVFHSSSASPWLPDALTLWPPLTSDRSGRGARAGAHRSIMVLCSPEVSASECAVDGPFLKGISAAQSLAIGPHEAPPLPPRLRSARPPRRPRPRADGPARVGRSGWLWRS
jgi:hypothetical protein